MLWNSRKRWPVCGDGFFWRKRSGWIFWILDMPNNPSVLYRKKRLWWRKLLLPIEQRGFLGLFSTYCLDGFIIGSNKSLFHKTLKNIFCCSFQMVFVNEKSWGENFLNWIFKWGKEETSENKISRRSGIFRGKHMKHMYRGRTAFGRKLALQEYKSITLYQQLDQIWSFLRGDVWTFL